MTVEVIGLIGNDAEAKTSKTGKNYIYFSVAQDKYDKGEITTTWAYVTWYVENPPIMRLLKKGMPVFVRGDMEIIQNNRTDAHAPYSVFIYPTEVRPFPYKKNTSQKEQEGGGDESK